jgi:hypothetical protein
MSRNAFRTRLAVLGAIAIGATVLSMPQALAASPAKPGGTKTVTMSVDVAGFVEVVTLKDTTSDCFPGIRYRQTNKVTFETGKGAQVRLTNVALPGTDGLLTSTFSPPVGSAKVNASLSDQHTTNFCQGAQEQLPPFPACTNTAGKVSVSLQNAGIDAVDDLVGLNGKWLNLVVQRVGGQTDDPTCLGRGPDQLTGRQTKGAVVTSSFAPSVFVSVPTGVGSIAIFTAKPGKRFQRATVFSGPCTSVSLSNHAGAGPPAPDPVVNADGDCFLTGKVVMTLTKK